MQIEIVWPTLQGETDGDTLIVENPTGFSADDLAEMKVPSGVTASVGDGSIGKGASGPGVALILEVAEHVLADVASLIGIGYALRDLIKRLSKRRGSPPAGASALSLAALAAAQTPAITQDPGAWYHSRTVPLTTDGSSGTDMRDVWASAFVNDAQGVVQVIFVSSTTRYLGTIVVATEWMFDSSSAYIRSDAELADRLRAWFAP